MNISNIFQKRISCTYVTPYEIKFQRQLLVTWSLNSWKFYGAWISTWLTVYNWFTCSTYWVYLFSIQPVTPDFWAGIGLIFHVGESERSNNRYGVSGACTMYAAKHQKEYQKKSGDLKKRFKKTWLLFKWRWKAYDELNKN